MTYIQTRSTARQRYHRRPRGALSGFFDVLESIGIGIGTGGIITGSDIQNARDITCTADADSSVASMAAEVADLERTWNPTGFYTADQMQTVVFAALNAANGARDNMIAALRQVDIGDSAKAASKREFDSASEALNSSTDKSSVFINAIKDARAKGTRAINAPGLKLWAVQVMRDAVKLSRAAAFLLCNRSLLERFSTAVNRLIDQAVEIIKKVVGIVLAAGEKALDVAGDLFGLLLSVMKFAPYALIAGGGFYLYKRYRER
jgi:hypothetical protein